MPFDYKPLARELEKANQSKLEPATLMAILASHREGDLAAAGRLRSGLQSFAFAAAQHFVAMMRRRYGITYLLEDLIGEAHLALATAVDRLADKTVPDVEAYVKAYIFRRIRKTCRDESRHIYVPSSTSSTRKKLGKEPHKSLMCRWSGSIHSNLFADERLSAESPMEHPCLPVTTPSGEAFRRPSKYLNQLEGITLVDWKEIRDKYARGNRRHRRILTWLWTGRTLKEVAIKTGTSFDAVRGVYRRLAERAATDPLLHNYLSASDTNLSRFGRSDAPHATTSAPIWPVLPRQTRAHEGRTFDAAHRQSSWLSPITRSRSKSNVRPKASGVWAR